MYFKKCLGEKLYVCQQIHVTLGDGHSSLMYIQYVLYSLSGVCVMAKVNWTLVLLFQTRSLPHHLYICFPSIHFARLIAECHINHFTEIVNSIVSSTIHKNTHECVNRRRSNTKWYQQTPHVDKIRTILDMYKLSKR